MSIDHWHYSRFPEIVGRTKVDADRIPFIWKTSKDELYYLEDMDTIHLFNTARMLYNNVLVPPAFRVLDPDTGSFIRHPEIWTWNPDYIAVAFELMVDELRERDLDTDLENQIQDMEDNLEFLCGLSES